MKAREFSLVTKPVRWRRLPVRGVKWLPDGPVAAASVERYRSPITIKGHNAGVKPPNWQQTYPAEPLNTAEVLALMGACDDSKAGVRNRALIVFLWRTGLRISEALALRTHHVDFDAKTVVVLKGKGSKRRTVGIDQGALAEMPSLPLILARFESWNTAVEAAGLRPGGARPKRTDGYTADACLRAALLHAEQLGRAPSHNEYDVWQRTQPGMPCGTLVRRKCGGWGNVVRYVHRELETTEMAA